MHGLRHNTQQDNNVANPRYVHIASSDVRCLPIPFSETIYTGSAVGSNIVSGGLEDYSLWHFQVTGVDADDDVSIAVSLDGYTFAAVSLINIANGTEVAAGSNIEVPGIYRIGTQATSAALNDNPFATPIKAIKTTRETATGGNAVTVYAIGQ